MTKSSQFQVLLDVVVRPCEADDLLALEWFGLHTDFRAVIASAFDRQLLGENMMLVAEANRFPIGQIWIDLAKRQSEAIGVLWALRVIPPLQNLGIGSTLIASAERFLTSKGYGIAELGVEKSNVNAKRLYERIGYAVIGDNVEQWDYVTPQGRTVHMVEHEWILHKLLPQDPQMHYG